MKQQLQRQSYVIRCLSFEKENYTTISTVKTTRNEKVCKRVCHYTLSIKLRFYFGEYDDIGMHFATISFFILYNRVTLSHVQSLCARNFRESCVSGPGLSRRKQTKWCKNYETLKIILEDTVQMIRKAVFIDLSAFDQQFDHVAISLHLPWFLGSMCELYLNHFLISFIATQ